MVRSPTSPPSAPLGPSPSGCPTAESSPAVRALVCAPGAPTPSDTDGSAVPVQLHSETDLRRSRGWHRCPPGPLPPPLCWTLLVAKLLAGCPADKPYRREARTSFPVVAWPLGIASVAVCGHYRVSRALCAWLDGSGVEPSLAGAVRLPFPTVDE